MYANPPPPRLFNREQFSELYDFQFDIQRFAEEVSVVKISGKVNNVEVGDTFTVNNATYTVLSVETESVTASVEGSNPDTDLGKEIKISDTKSIGDGNTSITSSTLFTIDGLSTADNLTLTDKVVAVGEPALGSRAKDTITIDNDYTFSLVSSGGATTIAKETTKITADGVYQFEKGYSGTLTISATATNVKLIGNGSLTDVFIDVRAENANLWIKDLKISTKKYGNNLIKFGSGTNYLTVEGENTLTNSASNNANDQAVINSGSGTLNILGTGTLTAKLTGGKSYGAAIGGDSVQTVGNINIGGTVTVTASAKEGAGIGSGWNGKVNNITIGGNATVKATSNGGAGIGSGYGGTASVGSITIGGSATVNAKGGAGIGSGAGGTVGDIKIGTGATITSNNATITGTDSTLDDLNSNLTSTDPASSSIIYGTGGKEGWYLEDNTATFNLAGLSEYFTLESGEKQITYHEATLGAELVKIGGISNTDNMSLSGTGVTLTSDNISSDGATVLAGGQSYEFFINGGEGGKVFNGTAGDDTISNYTVNMTINGLSGDDILTNTGNNVSLNGGEGSNVINLNGGTGVTVNVSEGDDIINLDNSFTKGFAVVGFSAGDTITGSNLKLSDDGKSFLNGDNAISGLTVGSISNSWSEGTDSISYQKETVAGASLADNMITWLEGGASKFFTIDGLSSSDNLTLTDKVVTVGESALWARAKDTITIDNDYTFSFNSSGGATNVEQIGSINTIAKGTTKITADGVYQFADDFTGTLTISAKNVKLIGASKTLTDVFIDVTAPNANLWIKDLDITTEKFAKADDTNYRLIRFGSGTNYLTVEGENTLTNSADDWDHEQAVINSGSGTLNILGTGKLTAKLTGNDSFGAAIGGDCFQTVGNINIGGSVQISATSNYSGAGIGSGNQGTVGDITIGGTATVTTTASRGAGIGSGEEGTVVDIKIGGSATVDASANTGGEGIGKGKNGTAGTITVKDESKIKASSHSTWTVNSTLTTDADKLTSIAPKGSSMNVTIDKDGVYQFVDGFTGTVTVTAKNVKLIGNGSLTDVFIDVTAENANLWIKDLNISTVDLVNDNDKNLIKFGAGNNYLTVEGTNTLTKSASFTMHTDKAVINSGNGTLNILGTGTLTAQLTGTSYCAAIGGDNLQKDTGNINIGGSVTINATASDGGAGIGAGGSGTVVGTITIGGKAKVNASSNGGAGIGSGWYYCPAVTIKIGGSATVNASSNEGAGIGSGSNSTAGSITIGGKATVNATSNDDGADDIGAGKYGEAGTNTYGTGATVNNTAGDTEGLDDLDVNITAQSDPAGDSSGGDASVIYGVGGQSGWYLKKDTATFNLAGLSEYFTLESSEKQITYHEATLGAELVRIGGISTTDNMLLSGTGVTLTSDNISSDGATVLAGGQSYGFFINGGKGSKVFNGSAGDDTISNYAVNMTINGLSGDDILTNTGNNVSLNGGDGSNVINLNGGTNVTVNVSEGDDIINLDNSFTNGFAVVGFSAGDTIKGNLLTVNNGQFYNNNNVISGLSVGSISNYWNEGTDNISYHSDTVTGASLSDNMITWLEGSASKIFTIDGLSSSDNLTLTDKVVMVGESALWARAKDTITIDNGYKFSFNSSGGATNVEQIGSINTLANGTTAITADGVYQFADDFTGTLTISATNVKLIGASKTLTDVFIDASGVEGVNLWIKDLNITTAQYATASSGTNYHIIRFGSGNNYLTVEGENTLTNSSSNGDNEQAVINSGSGTLNILGTGTLTAQITGDKSFGAVIGGDYGKTVGNITIGGSATVNASSNGSAGIGSGASGTVGDITIGGNANVTASGKYGAGIGAGASGKVNNITIGGTAQVTATSSDGGAGIGKGAGSDSNSTVTGTITVKDESKINASSHSNWTVNPTLTTDADNLTSIAPKMNVTIDKDGVYQFVDGFTGTVTVTAKNVKLIGNGSLTDVFIDVTAENANLWIKDLNITTAQYATASSGTNYHIIRFGSGNNYLTVEGENTLTNSSSNGDNEQAVINSGSGTLNILGSGSLTAQLTGYESYGAAIGGDCYQTVGNINIGGSVTINTTTKNGAGIGSGYSGTAGDITIGGSANVTASSNWGAGIGSGTEDGKVNNITIGGSANVTASSVNGADIGAGYNGSVSGNIRYGTGATVNGNKGTTEGLDDLNSNLTSTDPASSSSGGGASVIYGTGGKEGWYLEDNIATFNLAGLSDYFTLESGEQQITYHEETLGAELVKIGGISITDNMSLSGTGVTLTSDNISSDGATVLAGGQSYGFFINGGAGGKVFNGSNGNDTISNYAVNMTINGGTGADIINNSGVGATILGDAGNDTITNTADNAFINGGADKDLITNSGVGATIDGGAGDDTISNTAGNAFINGGADKDLITNSGLGATVLGDAGNDTISNTAGNAVIDGGSDNDTITNSGVGATIDGGAGADIINNSGANSKIYGGAGNDTITNESANVTINSGYDNDLITNSGANASVNGGSGNDSISNSGAGATVLGDAGNDTISNTAGNAFINGDADKDLITNSGVGATIDGGAGDDTINNTADNAFINGGADKDLITNSGVGATVLGDAGDDTINNTAGNAFINGGADKDLITNSGVGATIDGDAGNDTINNTADNAFINGGADKDLITNSGVGATIDGGAGDDTIINTAVNAFINGGASNDLIINDGNNVTVSGGDGNDFINFAGKDGIVMFSNGSDTINYSEYYTIDFNNGTGYKNMVDGGDILIYDDNNTLRVIDAFGKQINVKNYNGVAESVISSGRNTAAMLTYNSKKTQVTLNGTAEATVSGKKLFVGKLNSSDYSSTAVTLTAGEGANEGKQLYIEGNAKANRIYANSVGGTMNGGTGNDRLNGNIGADVFAYRVGQGRDSIWNYDGTMDKIQLLEFVEGETKFGYDVNSAGNIVMTVGSNYITIVDPFTNADSTTVTVVGSNGTTELNVSGYTYTKNSIADPQGKVTLASAAMSYAITDKDQSIDATKVTGAVAIDATNLAKNLTVTGLGSNATIKGIALSAIATSEFTDNNVALGLENGVLTLADVTTNTVQLDEGNFYVGKNYLYQGNAVEAQATGFTLTSGNTAGLDKSSSTAGLSIFGGFVINNIGLSGSSGDDFITTGLGDDTVYGGGGSDTFVFGGGKDTFFDYQFGEDVINAGDLDIDNGNYDSTTGFVTINQGGNSSISIFVDKNNPNPQITFTNGTNTTIKNYGQIGNFNEELTSVTLYSSVKFTDDNKAGFIAEKLVDADPTYSQLSTIVADNVTSDEVATIKGLAGISSYISAGEKMLALIGGNMDDTLVSGGGSALFTGGTGADLFKPGTGEDVITDYNFAEGDLIELADGYDIGSISRLDDNVDGEDGIKLIFDENISLGLSGIDSTNAVMVNGASYLFDPTSGYQKIFTGDNKGVTVLSSGKNITADANELKGAETVIIRDGGTITAATAGGKTIGGKNVTLTGADGADTFLYTGGDVLVDKYTSTADKLTLASGITILNSTVNTDNNTVDITVTGGGKLQVKVEDESATSIVVNTSAGDQVIYINQKGDIFDRRNHPSANAVTVVGAYGDFGVLVDDSADEGYKESDKGPGEEYYSVLFSITAAQENSTLIGNSQSNYLIANSGTKNVLTGGIGKDYFIFNSGGGEIRDFGGGATKNSDKKVMAGETNQEADGTYLAYDRSDPTTYKESTDVLQVNGTVKAIAYTGKGDDTTAKTSNKFTAYVVYDQDGDDATTDDLFVIRLNNIYKQPIKFGTNLTYRTDDYVAERFKIWDMSTGTMATLDLAAGGANADLLTTVADSGYSDKIAELDNILPDQTSWTPGEYVYPTKDSGGLNGGLTSAAPSGNNDPSSNKQNNG